MRYILFAYSLMSDCLYLVMTNVMLIMSYFQIVMQIWLCLILLTVTSMYTLAFPITLTAMTLERFVAICMPMRHGALCTPRNALHTILIINTVSAIPIGMALSAYFALVPHVGTYTQSRVCAIEILIIHRWQNQFRSTVTQLYFFMMLALIVFCNSTSPTNLPVIIKVCVVAPFFCIFLYCIVLMLYIFASNRHFMDSTRYVLFAFMLVNDTLQLLTAVLLFLLAMGRVRFPIVFCAPLLFFSTATFLNTPLILATMSLERYVAIMYPLQCPPVWRPDRVWIILLCLWLISCVLPLVDFSIGETRPGVSILSTPIYCNIAILNSSPVQALFKVSLNGLFFAVVALIILYTYIRILLETKKMRQDRASVSKAMHTVLLHGFQLLLCLMAFTNPITEKLLLLDSYLLPSDIYFFTFFCFVLIPRFLSPLIYGWRDKSLSDHMRKATLCCSHSLWTRSMVKPSAF
ncbi:hypothetical protein NHX12_008429 [Muraenolepis orangiensis]|uniref:G-protein coupled receptors family 1 profile domain-containing protein n=1 Tax=Muraenolepis orangiensis TaxID=630683 RepID=A0A9Q0DN05_9TELE|nr:hypothetical protein NHX12_008429 [Muraenolepis orangiensis]